MKKIALTGILLLGCSAVGAQKIYQSGFYSSKSWKVIDTIRGTVTDKYYNKQFYWLSIKGKDKEYRINVTDTTYFKKIEIDQPIAIPVHKLLWTNAWKKNRKE